MRPSYVPRPKPDLLDWIVVAMSIVAIVLIVIALTGLAPNFGTPD